MPSDRKPSLILPVAITVLAMWFAMPHILLLAIRWSVEICGPNSVRTRLFAHVFAFSLMLGLAQLAHWFDRLIRWAWDR